LDVVSEYTVENAVFYNRKNHDISLKYTKKPLNDNQAKEERKNCMGMVMKEASLSNVINAKNSSSI